MGWVKDTMKIRGEDVSIRRGELEHIKLKFYPENPRLFSIVKPDEVEPDQEDIQKRLLRMQHVKALVQDIKSNGGLIDPIIVRDGTYEVLEGNSRLAAYRRLSESEPIIWGKIKCILLPKEISDSQIFSILGQYHIIGKKDWSPFEQAGFLYRRNIVQGIPIERIASEIGLSSKEINRLIKTYSFMIEVNDTNMDKWSYYYELKNSRKITTLSKRYDGFENAVVSKIKSGEIDKAVDIRDGVTKLTVAKKNLVSKFISGDLPLKDVIERIEISGNADGTYQWLKRFRTRLVSEEIDESIGNATKEARQKMHYEFKHISRATKRMLSKLS